MYNNNNKIIAKNLSLEYIDNILSCFIKIPQKYQEQFRTIQEQYNTYKFATNNWSLSTTEFKEFKSDLVTLTNTVLNYKDSTKYIQNVETIKTNLEKLSNIAYSQGIVDHNIITQSNIKYDNTIVKKTKDMCNQF